jgi:hypothetical protein
MILGSEVGISHDSSPERPHIIELSESYQSPEKFEKTPPNVAELQAQIDEKSAEDQSAEV